MVTTLSYYREYATSIRFSSPKGGLLGLRRPQAGAAHAVAAHFSLRTDPALVCMPTGSGKTAVILMCPYLLRCERALLITPSTIVRGQIAENARENTLLERLSVLAPDIPSPEVFEVTKRITSRADWRDLEKHDLVVATPHTVSPFYKDIPEPPTSLFDLILVDEAQHEAARGWRELLDSMPDVPRVLFSATPFRRDRKEVRGRFVYTYPLREAFKDGSFGKVRFVPAEGDEADPDTCIAKTASRVLRADHDKGLPHRIMVRTGSKARARDLAALYAANTDLQLRVVTSDHSYRFAKKAIKQMQSGDLDGVICVDMLGEGFDLPELKVAALHAPHKSLAVTLQFIGRFARTGSGTGEASVVAKPEEVGKGVSKLYDEDATWPEMLIDFAGTAIGHEESVREAISTFDEPEAVTPQLENLSLYGLRPFCHSKVYREMQDVDICAEVVLPSPYEVVFRQDSTDLSMTVFVARAVRSQKWTDTDSLATIEYELFACYYDEENAMLFINASRRNDSLYECIAGFLGDGSHSLVSSVRMNRVLRNVESASFFHVGMKNSTASSSLESYVTKTGSRAHDAVSPQEGKLYHRGHVMAKGRKDNKGMTIGFSSSSRVWSMQYPQLTEWREWCKAIALDISNEQPFKTGTNLDILDPGVEVENIPQDVLAARWPEHVFRKAAILRYEDSDGRTRNPLLQDVDIDVDLDATPPGTPPSEVRLRIAHTDTEYYMRYSPSRAPWFRYESIPKPEPLVAVSGEEIPLLVFVNNHPPSLVLSNCSFLEGQDYRERNAERRPIDHTSFIPIDWESAGASINLEYVDGEPLKAGDGSIHGHMLTLLAEEKANIVVYDHGSGEAADFIAIWDRDDSVLVRFYHCKKTRESKPGCRLKDLYEVVGQAVKTNRWIHRPNDLLDHIERRSSGKAWRFPTGRLRDLASLLDKTTKTVKYEVALVQPGLSIQGLSDAAADVIGSANEFLWRDVGGRDLLVLGSV